ncbi:CocE/NonD family hydrolase [Nakamurella sp. A5-74]|uniref:CocE/NonD family hydrolase n=1 Tax=Nakamurella sp. A5-74 TaxID=3158264 RepID=A0AAU8DUT4_9ACTN
MNRSRTALWAAPVLMATCALTGAAAAGAAGPAVPTSGAVASDVIAVTHAQNDRVPEGASWTQHYFPSSDGSDTELHADVLLPEGLVKGEKVPVILSVGSYYGHAGQNYPEGFTHTGPSDRFSDLIEDADLFARGYALVMVDSRGFGGSSGCLELAGRGQQADVRAAIDWSADQRWSTGSVGMYGKSYDAITGLVGNNLDQDALKAVVAQEPIWDVSRNFRSNGVPRTTIVEVPNVYNASAASPQMPDDEPRYLANAGYELTHPECLQKNSVDARTSDPQSEYWRSQDLSRQAKGSDTPLFVTQGFIEWNTEAEGMQEFLANHQGPERGWLGQWDHVRGNDRTPDGQLEMGREGWFAEVMSFYDQYLKGIAPTSEYPAYSIQDSTGTWRAQDTWPAADSRVTLPVGRGSYLDDGRESGTDSKNSFITRSEPLDKATRITGTPRISLNAVGQGNVMVKLHDVAPDGTAVIFDEQVSLLSSGRTNFDLRSTDWTLAAGHSLAVEIGTITPDPFPLSAEFGPGNGWLGTPSQKRITVTRAQLRVALDNPADDTPTAGGRSPYLDVYLAQKTGELPTGTATVTIPASTG